MIDVCLDFLKGGLIRLLGLWVYAGLVFAQAPELQADSCRGPLAQKTWQLWDDAGHAYAQQVLQSRLLERGDTYVLYDLQTLHHNLLAIVDGLQTVAQSMPLVWPLHPRTQGVLQRMGRLEGLSSNVRLIDPVGYLDMVQLEKYTATIATDSGGVQKEAFFYRVPCVTLRDETEWVELVEAGWNRLAPPRSAEVIAASVGAALGSTGKPVAPYGKGDAGKRIVDSLLRITI